MSITFSTTPPRKPSRWKLRILLILAFACGWWGRGRFVAPQPAPPQVVAQEPAAGRDIDILLRQLAEQRALLRDDALKAQPTADEMLALIPTRFTRGDWSRPELGQVDDCWFETVDGVRLHGWYLPQPDSRGSLLLLHGNGGNVPMWVDMAEELRSRLRLSVLVFDYRGYGRSEGVPTFDGLIRDAQAARDHLAIKDRIAAKDVILLGRSMGGAIATQVAARDGARALILERTFATLRDVAGSHYPRALVNVLVADRLRTIDELPKYQGPLLISHGQDDTVIPFAQGRTLFDAAREPKRFVDLGPVGHNDPSPEAYWIALEEFAQGL